MAREGLKRSIGLLDATLIDLGAIVGAGIFVILGIAESQAGPAILVAVLLAGLVSLLTALSFDELSQKISSEGGVYEFAHQLESPFFGFITGFLWLASNIVAGAVVALGFAQYFSLIFPWASPVPVAFFAVTVATLLNYFGLKHSATVNDALVALKLLVLLLFVAVGAWFFKASNFVPFAPNGVAGVFSGAALLFFAFSGFGRATTISGEVKNPRKTVPKAIMISLFASFIIYLLVSGAAVGLAGSAGNAASGSEAYLAQVISSYNIPYAVLIVSIGALAATASVLLTTVLGVSRVLLAMARNNEAPAGLKKVNPVSGNPDKAVIAGGLASSLLVLVGNLTLVASISSFGLLAYYASANYSALKLAKPAFPKIVPVLGILTCIVFIFFLSLQSVGIGVVGVLGAVAYYKLFVNRPAGNAKHPMQG